MSHYSTTLATLPIHATLCFASLQTRATPRFASPQMQKKGGPQSHPSRDRCSDGSTLPLQPPSRDSIALEEALCLFRNLLMIRVQPLLLPFTQQADFGQFLAHGRHGDVFEAQVRFVAELELRLDFLDCYDVCNLHSQHSPRSHHLVR